MNYFAINNWCLQIRWELKHRTRTSKRSFFSRMKNDKSFGHNYYWYATYQHHPPTYNLLQHNIERGNLFGYNDNVWCSGPTSSIRRYDTLKEEIRHNHVHEVHYFCWASFSFWIPPTHNKLHYYAFDIAKELNFLICFWYLQIFMNSLLWYTI